jgi:hypothetical protein
MSEKARRKKTILLFLAISLFAYFTVRNFGNTNTQIEALETEEYILTENIQNQTEENEDLVQDVFLEIDEDLNPVKRVYPELVLSETDTTQCRTTDLVYSSERVCSTADSQGSIDADLESTGEVEVGTVISRDATISLVSVVVPPLLSGSPTMDSEVRQIYRDAQGKYHWTLKPAGEMVSRKIVESNTYPGDENTKAILDAADSSRNVPFGVEYNINVGGDASGGGENQFTVDQYYTNDCGEKCNNPSSGTLQKYLDTSSILAGLSQIPGYYDEVDEQEVSEGIENCSEDSTFLDMDIDGTAPIGCTPSLKEVVVSFVKRIKNLFDVNSCTEGSEEEGGDCVSTANIVIIMESPWGTKTDCAENDQCVNEFNRLREGTVKIPGEDTGGGVYVLTDCVARVEGVGEQNLKCAWDIEYIAKEVEYQSYDNLPGEDYPDTMEYLNFHINEAENRTEEPKRM